MYFHGEGSAPDFEVPEVPELASSEWTGWRTQQTSIGAPLSDINENIVDVAHFYGVHDFGSAVIHDVRAERHQLHVAVRAEVRLLRGDRSRRFNPPIPIQAELDLHGPGIQSDRVKIAMVGFVVFTRRTPIDESRTQVWRTYGVRKAGTFFWLSSTFSGCTAACGSGSARGRSSRERAWR
jgi:hypothetical protein